MKLAPGLARLAATCGALTVALLPHVGHLPAWVSGAVLAAMAWRLAAEHWGWALPSRTLRFAALLAATCGVLAGYRTLNGLDAGTALLAITAGLKLTETRAPRDHAVLVFIGYFLCLATLLYQQSFLRLFYAVAAAWLLTAALARVHRPIEANTPVRPFRLAARVLSLGVPLAVVLFLFVPRLEGRFWALPATASHRTTGIDDEMSPGDVASLSRSDDPAFRSWFTGALPSPAQRYWRMLVLEEFDGRTWRRPRAPEDLAAPPIESQGPVLAYRIALEATGREWLPGLDTVVGWPRDTVRRGRATELRYYDPSLRDRRDVTTRLTYELRSDPRAVVMAAGLPPDLARRDLALPPAGRPPRALELARSLRAAARDERDYVARVLDMFRNEKFSYTLEPPPLGAEPVDEFLFETRAGFCEHYASAFAVLMRAAGIPARVVVGYQGGEFNRYGGYLLVRQSSAHAWNEVWLAGAGWLRVDPTAAVAPERVARGELSGEFAGDAAPGRLYRELPWLQDLRAAWDAARTGWYERVVNFNSLAQARLLVALGLGDRGWAGLALALTAGFVIAAAALAAWLGWELRPRPRDPVDAGWTAVGARLATLGLPREKWEGPVDYARRVAGAWPVLAVPIRELVDAYVLARYLPAATETGRARFTALARRFLERLGALRP
jgi:transglutaminase-like putative cysteine protease